MRAIQCCLLPVGLIVLLIFAGCSKSDETPTNSGGDPELAQERVNQANQIFTSKLSLFFSSGGSDTTAYDMSAANSLYGEALTADANNLHAHFGYAVTEMINLNRDPSIRSLFGGTNGWIQPIASVLSGHQSSKDILKLLMGQSTLSPASGPLPLSPDKIYHEFRGDETSVLFSSYQDVVETRMLPVLADAITHFSRITLDPNFAYFITEEAVRGSVGDSIRIDLTEIYLLLAVTQSLNGIGSFLTAYNVDYDARDQSAVLQAWQSGSPFLAFRSNGAKRMKDTKSSFVGMASSLQNGITFLLNETPHPGIDLIRYRPQDVQQLQSAIGLLDSVKSVFSNQLVLRGDYNGDGYAENLTVNFSNFFDNAIPDFKAKLPAYTVETQLNSDGSYSAVLVWQATSFSTWTIPDATFNNFLPGMTDASFKQTFGLAAIWGQQWVIR